MVFYNSFSIPLFLVLSYIALAVVDGQTLLEKWAIEENPVTTFDENTNTFTQTFEVDDSIVLINTGGQIYDEGCREGGNAFYVQADGVSNTATTMAGTGLATLTFQLDLDILRLDDNILDVDPLDPQGANMRFCSRFLLKTDDATVEVTFLETIITLNFDLTAGFEITSFTTQSKERFETLKQKDYGAEAYLCDPANPSEELDSNIFSQGSVIQVCVKPNQKAIDDGLGLYSIDSFSWVKGYVEQPAVVGGGSASNGLTQFSCSPFSTYCSFTSMLYADFYKATREPTSSPTPAPYQAESPESYGGEYGGEYGGGYNSGSYSYYSCTLDLPKVNTTEFVHGACVTNGYPQLDQFDHDNLSYNYPTQIYPSPYTQKYSFSKYTKLFGDRDYTADIAYNGDGYDRNPSLCEGGNYFSPNIFEENIENRSIRFRAQEDGAYSQSAMTMKPCFFVIDDDNIEDPENRRDGDSYHEWLIAEGYNETVTEFNILESDEETSNSTVVGTMKSYCFDFKEEDCYFFESNSGGYRDLASKMSSEVGGVGTATLAFPGTTRRKLEKRSSRNTNNAGATAGDDRSLQQNEPETVSSDIGMTILVLPREDDELEGISTAGGFGPGIQATSNAFFAAVGTGLFLADILV